MASDATEIALVKQRQDQIDAHLAKTDADVAALRDERDKALRWGLITLGTMFLGMATWIANFVLGHLSWLLPKG